MTANVMHIWYDDPRTVTIRGTYGLSRWLADRGYRGYRLSRGVLVPRAKAAEIEIVARREGWVVMVHDGKDQPGGAA